MNSNSVRASVATVAAILVSIFLSQTRSAAQSGSAIKSDAAPMPLLLEKNEGERRVWREPPPGELILKVSPKNNGSQHLVLGTEDMVPGDEIPTHKHLGQDEILLIEKGTAHVHLGDQERDLHAGGMVFIPAYTRVSVKNSGPETLSLVFVFSAPGFEDRLRCESVLADEKSTPLSSDEQKSAITQDMSYTETNKKSKSEVTLVARTWSVTALKVMI